VQREQQRGQVLCRVGRAQQFFQRREGEAQAAQRCRRGRRAPRHHARRSSALVRRTNRTKFNTLKEPPVLLVIQLDLGEMDDMYVIVEVILKTSFCTTLVDFN
jgi:predicted DNA-binding protein